MKRIFILVFLSKPVIAQDSTYIASKFAFNAGEKFGNPRENKIEHINGTGS